MLKMTQKRFGTAQYAPKLFEINHKPKMKISYNNHPRGTVPEFSRVKMSSKLLEMTQKRSETAQNAPKMFK